MRKPAKVHIAHFTEWGLTACGLPSKRRQVQTFERRRPYDGGHMDRWVSWAGDPKPEEITCPTCRHDWEIKYAARQLDWAIGEAVGTMAAWANGVTLKEAYKVTYKFCRVCRGPVDKLTEEWAAKKYEVQCCSGRCRTAEEAKLYCCGEYCYDAERTPCVCMVSMSCKTHNRSCHVGTHE